MPTDDNTKSTIERHEIDPILKEVLTLSFGELGIPIQTQVEISRLPRTMDVLVVAEQSGNLEKIWYGTAFDFFRVHNSIEFKGKNDPLTIFDYHLILGRAHLYLGERKISSSEMTVTIVSARKPIKVLRQSQNDVKWKEIGVGHYVSTDLLPVHLLVCNELPLEPKYYPLLLFASSQEKFRRFMLRLIEEENATYINYAFRANPDLTKEVLRMAGKQSLYEKQLERIAKAVGPDLISFLNKDELLEQIPPEVRVRGLSLEERLRGLNLDAETLEKLKELINGQDDVSS
jgi:hypothetical protein